MKKSVKKQSKKEEKNKVVRKTNPRIIITAIAALALVGLAFWNWIFIFPAVFLWWMNKKYIKKQFGV